MDNFGDKMRAMEHLFSDDTMFLESSNPEVVLYSRLKDPHLVVYLRSLNRIRHINTLFANINQSLSDRGCIACHCITSALHREKVLRQSPPVINRMVYALDFSGTVSVQNFHLHVLYFWVTAAGRGYLHE